MSVETQQATAPETAAPPPKVTVPGISQLRTSLADCKTKSAVFKTVAKYLFETLKAESVQVRIDDGVTSIDEGFHLDEKASEAWSRLCDGILVRARQHNQQMARTCDVPELQLQRFIFATPIPSGQQEPTGAIVVVTSETNPNAVRSQMREVETILDLVIELFRKPQKQASSTSPSPDADMSKTVGIARSAQYSSLSEFAYALTNGLKSKVGCEEVSLGIADKNCIRVLSISGLDDVYPRSPGSQILQQAMDECYDMCERISLPALPGNPTPAYALHTRWQQRTNATGVASLPLFIGDDCVGVISLRTNSDEFTTEQLDTIDKLASPLAPGLKLLRKADRSLSEHASDDARDGINKFRPTGRTAKAVFAIAVLTSLWMVFGWTDYVVRVPCEVVAENVTEIAAPFAGRIISAHVQPGDTITAGQILLEFDTQDIASERRKALAAYEIAQMELAMAVAAKDATTAGQARSRSMSAAASIDMLDERLRKAVVVAPRDGIVLDGELAPRVGETVQIGSSLIRIADHNSIAVEMRFPESDVTHVAIEQAGEFIISSRPSESYPCQIRRIDPSAEVIEGQNIFKAKATPLDPETTQKLRPGMRGLASVNTGSQPVWWVWLHGTINWVRLQAWSL